MPEVDVCVCSFSEFLACSMSVRKQEGGVMGRTFDIFGLLILIHLFCYIVSTAVAGLSNFWSAIGG
jgi:hypothetical protein